MTEANTTIVTFYCACFTGTVTSLLLLTLSIYNVRLRFVNPIFIQIYYDDDDDDDDDDYKMLRQTKQYGTKRLLSMSPNTQWSLAGWKKSTGKIDDTGKVDRRSAPGSGGHCTPYWTVAQETSSSCGCIGEQLNAICEKFLISDVLYWNFYTQNFLNTADNGLLC